MSEWYPSQHGFESGGAGTRSFHRRREPHIMKFDEWKVGLLVKLAKENIPVQQKPDGTIVAKFGTFTQNMSPALQQENYNKYLNRTCGQILRM